MSLYLGENKIADNTCSRNIGEIVASTIPLSDAGLHLLDGALISSAGSYAKFVNYIAGLVTDYPDLFTTEANWQSAVSTYGVCGKFVYDSVNNTVRLPKITGFTEGTTDVTALGDLVEAGLPNITGYATLHAQGEANIFYEFDGALSGSGGSTSQYRTPSSLSAQSGANSKGGINLNASSSNSIYGNSSTVQPQSIKVLYYIVIASSITNELNLDVADMATKSLDNLDNIGKNIANWSNNVTNCITEIPQDIKLEINSNGKAVLKAGSKVYTPNGFTGTTPKFDVDTVASDIIYNFQSSQTGKYFITSANNGQSAGWARVDSARSGTSTESTTSFYYRTDDNKVYYQNNSSSSIYTLPLAIVNLTNGVATIDQVFNGFGYIGSTVFAFPGVKGLIPNGRNADGTLKNIESTLTKVHTYWLDPAWGTGLNGYKFYLRVFDEVQGGYAGDVQPDTRVIYSKGIPSSTYTGVYYDTEENKWFWVNNGEISAQDKMFIGASFTANITASSFTVAGNFTSKTFHALDYNDSSTISGWAMPSSRYINLTLGASGATYTAPANGWFIFARRSSSTGQAIELVKPNDMFGSRIFSGSATPVMRIFIPVRKNDAVDVKYEGTNTTDQIFRFIYAEGEN